MVVGELESTGMIDGFGVGDVVMSGWVTIGGPGCGERNKSDRGFVDISIIS
jgi:hypothetical protein